LTQFPLAKWQDTLRICACHSECVTSHCEAAVKSHATQNEVGKLLAFRVWMEVGAQRMQVRRCLADCKLVDIIGMNVSGNYIPSF